jgi:hypothetical protein
MVSSLFFNMPKQELTSTKKGYLHPLIFEPGMGWIYGAGMDWAGRVV